MGALQQVAHFRHSLGRDDAKLGGMAAYRIDQHRALLHQKLAASQHHQRRLLLGALDRHETHARPAHRFADRFGIERVVLAALDPGLRRGRRRA
jgi:hypothetical protein